METDISRMGDSIYDHSPMENEYPSQQQQQQQQSFQAQPFQYEPIPVISQPAKKNDIFSDIDKKTWILILIAIILGFFMGKTMQPIILRSS